MSEFYLGILGGGQLGSMLSLAAKKLGIKTIVYCNDADAPAQNFCDEFIFGEYNDNLCLEDFVEKAKVITYEFENIPYLTLDEINKKNLFYQNHLSIDLYSIDWQKKILLIN